MTTNPEQEAYTPEEIDKALELIKFTPDIVPVDRLKKLMRKYLQANRQPKARPAFVDSILRYDGMQVCVQRVDDEGSVLVTNAFSLDNPRWLDPADLTHPDGAPVSRVFAPVPNEIHVSQLKSFDELEDGRRYLPRNRKDNRWEFGPRTGEQLKERADFYGDRYDYYPLPIVEGSDE